MPDTPATPEVITLHLDLIRTDGGTQPRAELDQATIERYAEAMQAGATFPPIDVYYDGTAYWLADGFHRLAARRHLVDTAYELMWTKINATVHQGTRRDAVLRSLGANNDHGLVRSNADKRRAVLTMITDSEWSQWSDREIARQCKVSHTFVGNLRRETYPDSDATGNVYSSDDAGQGDQPAAPATRTYTRDGETRTMDVSNIGAHQQAVAAVRAALDEHRATRGDSRQISRYWLKVQTGLEYEPIIAACATLIELGELQVNRNVKLSVYPYLRVDPADDQGEQPAESTDDANPAPDDDTAPGDDPATRRAELDRVTIRARILAQLGAHGPMNYPAIRGHIQQATGTEISLGDLFGAIGDLQRAGKIVQINDLDYALADADGDPQADGAAHETRDDARDGSDDAPAEQGDQPVADKYGIISAREGDPTPPGYRPVHVWDVLVGFEPDPDYQPPADKASDDDEVDLDALVADAVAALQKHGEGMYYPEIALRVGPDGTDRKVINRALAHGVKAGSLVKERGSNYYTLPEFKARETYHRALSKARKPLDTIYQGAFGLLKLSADDITALNDRDRDLIIRNLNETLGKLEDAQAHALALLDALAAQETEISQAAV